MKDKRILVTGGTGVLGSYIVEALLADGYSDVEVYSRSGTNERLRFASDHRVTFTKGDVVALHPLSDAINRADYVIHAAALVTFHPSRFDKMHAVNVEGTANVVNLSTDNNITKLIHISSIAAIGRAENHSPINEESKWTNSKYNSYYGITKYLAEQEVWRAHHEGLNMAIVNPSLIFGGTIWDQSSQKIFSSVHKGLPYYPGGSTGIVDARDVAQLVIYLLQSDTTGERYITSGGNITYKDLFQKMAKAMHAKPPTKVAPAWMLAAFWRVERLRSLITGKEPIVTRETVKSTSHPSSYDNSKSLALDWGGYRNLDESIQEFCGDYLQHLQKE